MRPAKYAARARLALGMFKKAVFGTLLEDDVGKAVYSECSISHKNRKILSTHTFGWHVCLHFIQRRWMKRTAQETMLLPAFFGEVFLSELIAGA